MILHSKRIYMKKPTFLNNCAPDQAGSAGSKGKFIKDNKIKTSKIETKNSAKNNSKIIKKI